MVRAFCNDLYKESHSAMMFRDMNNLNTMSDKIGIYVSVSPPQCFLICDVAIELEFVKPCAC